MIAAWGAQAQVCRADMRAVYVRVLEYVAACCGNLTFAWSHTPA
jgi:hypothetical protein